MVNGRRGLPRSPEGGGEGVLFAPYSDLGGGSSRTVGCLFQASGILDCSQSPIFSWDRLDIPRLLTVTAILILKCTEGAGVGDYGWGGEG